MKNVSALLMSVFLLPSPLLAQSGPDTTQECGSYTALGTYPTQMAALDFKNYVNIDARVAPVENGFAVVLGPFDANDAQAQAQKWNARAQTSVFEDCLSFPLPQNKESAVESCGYYAILAREPSAQEAQSRKEDIGVLALDVGLVSGERLSQIDTQNHLLIEGPFDTREDAEQSAQTWQDRGLETQNTFACMQGNDGNATPLEDVADPPLPLK